MLLFLLATAPTFAGAAPGPPGETTLSKENVWFSVIRDGHLTLARDAITMVVADNQAYGPEHRAGYNGVSDLRHRERDANLFVPTYAGLNLEFIHDGSDRILDRDVLFEPRRHPMELRKINDHTAELYQSPTPNWKVESATRFALRPDGVIEMTFHCRATEPVFKYGYAGFFWASYIDRPTSKAIHFRGHSLNQDEPRWITAFTPKHGVLAMHPAVSDTRIFKRDERIPDQFLIFARSRYRYTEPFYYGVSHGMALVYMFRPEDQIRMTQSPTGGGPTNPAWDFQWFVPDIEVGQLYGFQMRAAYLPRTSEQDIAALARRHIAELTEPAR
jgi:hypothetical protein